MNVLVLGGGGREHALSWKLKQSKEVDTLYIAPGNAGTEALGENVALSPSDHESVVAFAKEKSIGLVVVGPDDALASGIVDALADAGVLVFGPTKAAAEIEWSKSYAKELMRKEGIPTARSELFTEYDPALRYVKARGAPIVVKADGLALGKGVTVAASIEEAEQALREAFLENKFGSAGQKVVIEEFLTGLEVSAHALCAGEDARMFPIAKDHKRVGEGDTGPNTGGMGTIVPVPNVSEEVIEDIRTTIVLPLLRGLAKRGRPFSGLLFPGIMLTSEGPKVIEFNARFGDPETQSYMRQMESDILPALVASAKGDLSGVSLSFKEGASACIVMASGGYPNTYEKGKEITGVKDEEGDGVVVFHAGTKHGEKGELLTNGGRVLNVSARGNTLKEALERAYEGVRAISFPGSVYRSDIGKSVLT